MSNGIAKLIEETHEAEFNAYMNYKKRRFEQLQVDFNSSSKPSESTQAETLGAENLISEDLTVDTLRAEDLTVDTLRAETSLLLEHLREVTVQLRKTRAKETSNLNYLSGPGTREWSPITNWRIKEYKISVALRAQRKEAISCAEQKIKLNDLEILSLSFIFPVQKDNKSRSITNKFYNKNEAKAILSVYQDFVDCIEPSTTRALNYCKAVVDAMDNDFDSGKNVEFANPTNKRSIMEEAIHYVMKNLFSSKVDLCSSSTSIERHVLIKATFQIMPVYQEESSSIYYYYSPAGEYRIGTKRAKCSSTMIHYFFIETVDPNQARAANSSQIESSFVKLMRRMKASIDLQVTLRAIDNPSSMGILAEDNFCFLYHMTIKADGVYVPIMIRKFRLCSSYVDLIHVPRLVEMLYYVRKELIKWKDSIHNYAEDKERGVELGNFIKPSFTTKMN